MAKKEAVTKRSNLEAIPVSKGKFDELGSQGLQRTGRRGLVDEEFLPELRDERGRRIYREMRDNDPVIGAILFAIEMLIRNASWEVRGGKDEYVEFVDGCFKDMSHTFEDLLSEILSMLVFGWSWHEIVYKQRLGPNSNPSKRSKYNDGKYGWRKIPIRAQSTLVEWVWDDEGGLQEFVQQSPPEYQTVTIPINRSLLFRTGAHKGNPEGHSLLRNCYRPWYFKNRLEVIEGIGVERDLAGLPVIYRSGEVAKLYDDELKRIVTNVRRDEQEGVLLPLAYDENGNPLIKFELLSSAGSRQMDVDKIINRYDRRIATTVLADFILLGQEKVGSFALASSKTNLFAMSLGAILQTIAAVFNRHAIPRLLSINSMKTDDQPELIPLDIESPDLDELGKFLTSAAGSGMPLFPDEDLENYLRKIAHLPERPEEGIQPNPDSGATVDSQGRARVKRKPTNKPETASGKEPDPDEAGKDEE